MKVQKAFKFVLHPTPAQEAFLRRAIGSCRYLWNKALAEQRRRRAAGEKRMGYAASCREFTQWRKSPETAWLAALPCHVGQQTLKDLERAFVSLFANRGRAPRFRQRGGHESFRVPDQFHIDVANSRVGVPKLGWVRFHQHRRIDGTARNLTISRHLGRWYVSIQVELEVPEPAHPALNARVGLDVGVARFATLSTGEHLEPLASFKKHEKRLAWAQRKLARKQLRSKNYAKQKQQVQRVHSRMADVRRDFLHKASSDLTRRFGVIVIEDLKLGNMTKSAKGTPAKPGRNVRAKAGLNKALLNHGLGEFRRQLEYKSQWRGGVVIAVDPRHTSQTCPSCSHVSALNRTSQSRFSCVACGHSGNADHVAAQNILARGLEAPH